MNRVKEGSLWISDDDKKFRVLHIVSDNEANTWVHYREELSSQNQDQPKEYSCFMESFTVRFRQLPE